MPSDESVGEALSSLRLLAAKRFEALAEAERIDSANAALRRMKNLQQYPTEALRRQRSAYALKTAEEDAARAGEGAAAALENAGASGMF